MAAKDPAARRANASLAGRTSMATGDPDELTARRRAAAAVTNSPASLARRIVKAWPALDRSERTEVRAILRAGGVILRT